MTTAEIERVKQQTLAQEAFKRDGTAGVVGELNEFVSVGDWTLYARFPQAIAQVSAADVQRVAKKYFNVDQSTTGWYVPTNAKQATMKNLFLAALFLGCAAAAQAGIADKVVRVREGGIDVIAYRTAIKDVVTIVGSLRRVVRSPALILQPSRR